MKKNQFLKEKFTKYNQELLSAFDEIFKNYESIENEYNSLKKEHDLLKNEFDSYVNKPNSLIDDYNSLINNNGINKDLVTTLLNPNLKFGIVNLAKLNKEAEFDAINYFNKLCPYCNNDLYGGNIRAKIEVDHFFPIAKGGQDFPWNLLPVCKKCNRKKRDILPYEFLEISTYNKCSKYLVNVMLKITNAQEDKLQRYEIAYNLLHDFNTKKQNKDKFINSLLVLFDMQTEVDLNNEIDLTKTITSLHEDIKREVENTRSYEIQVGVFYKMLSNSKTPNADIKKAIKQACTELFGDTIQKGGSTWKKTVILEWLKTVNEVEVSPLLGVG